MKQKTSGIFLLMALALVLPVTVTACSLWHYQLIVRWYSLQAILFCGLSVFMTCKLWKSEAPNYGKAVSTLLCLLALLSCINLYFALFHSRNVVVTAAAAGHAVCGFCLLFRSRTPTARKVISWILAILLLLPFAFCAFLILVFGQIGQNTVVNSIPSPSGCYVAEVIDSDQGALGGDTIVQVKEPDTALDLGLCVIQKKPMHIYLGEWREYENMQIAWETDDTLLINSHPYPIP